jgi:hypothetical protein
VERKASISRQYQEVRDFPVFDNTRNQSHTNRFELNCRSNKYQIRDLVMNSANVVSHVSLLVFYFGTPSPSMVDRRTNSRRRRVLNEEIVRTDEVALEDQSAVSRRANLLAYSSGANRRNQLKTTDLLPKRWLAFSTVVTCLLSCVGLLNVLAFYAPSMGPYIGEHGLAAFAISGKGTLANWFICFLLIAASIASLQIYALRKHRRDDYQGSYRLWSWLAALFLLMSIDCAVDLRTILMSLFESLTHRTMDGSWLLLAIPIVILAVVSIRCMFEVRASSGAMTTVFLVWMTYSAAVLANTPAVKQQLAQFDVPMIFGNCVLLATAGLVIAHLVYARFVYLHAHGLIERAAPVQKEAASKAKKKTTKQRQSTAKDKPAEEVAKAKKTKKVERSAKTEKSTKTKSVELAEKQVATTETTNPKMKLELGKRKKSKSTKKRASSQESDSYDDDEATILSMSKSEKRRRRKLQKRSAKKAA